MSASDYEFDRGFPTSQAAQQSRDDADFDRAVTAYRFWYPTVSVDVWMFGRWRSLATALDNAMPL